MTQHNILMLVYSAATTRRCMKSASRCEGWNGEDCEKLKVEWCMTVTINLTKGHLGKKKKRETASERCELPPSLASTLPGQFSNCHRIGVASKLPNR